MYVLPKHMNKRVLAVGIALCAAVMGAFPVFADSLNLQRIDAKDQYEAAVKISQLVYPFGPKGTYPYMPGAVILVNGEDHLSALVGASLIHHPRNAPILYTKKDSLPEITKNEIVRLVPTGQASETQVLVVGGPGIVSDKVLQEVKDLGFTISRIGTDDILGTAEKIDQFLVYQGYIYHLALKRDIILFPVELRQESAIPASWVAHWDASVLFTYKDSLPEETVRAIRARSTPPSVFIIGGEDVVSSQVENKLYSLPIHSVDRVGGTTLAEVAVNFAKFKKGDFGWGYTDPGSKAFVLTRAVTKENVMTSVAAAIFGHLGKHAPLLFTDPDGTIGEQLRSYLKSVQPFIPISPGKMFENHGYLINVAGEISDATESAFNDLIAGDNNLAIVSGELIPETVAPGETAQLILHAHNFSMKEETYTVSLKVNGKVEDRKTVTLAALPYDLVVKNDVDIRFSIAKKDPGVYHIEAGGYETFLTVSGSASVTGTPQFVTIAGILAGVIIVLFFVVRFTRRSAK